jgi:hypothetical protein
MEEKKKISLKSPKEGGGLKFNISTISRQKKKNLFFELKFKK